MCLKLMGCVICIYIYFYIIGNIFISLWLVIIEVLFGILELLLGKFLGIICIFIYEEMLIFYVFWIMCFFVCIKKNVCMKFRFVLLIFDFFVIICLNFLVVYGDYFKKKKGVLRYM